MGDDSTCDSQLNEWCKAELSVSSCHCRPGFTRTVPRGPCTRQSNQNFLSPQLSWPNGFRGLREHTLHFRLVGTRTLLTLTMGSRWHLRNSSYQLSQKQKNIVMLKDPRKQNTSVFLATKNHSINHALTIRRYKQNVRNMYENTHTGRHSQSSNFICNSGLAIELSYMRPFFIRPEQGNSTNTSAPCSYSPK